MCEDYFVYCIGKLKIKKHMKNLILVIFLILECIVQSYAQDSGIKVRLGYLTANFANPSYVNGKLKSMTQITYSAKMINGNVIKGEELKDSVAMSTVGIQHITYSFNEAGEMTSATYFHDNGTPYYLTIIDNEKGKINKVYYIYKDTLRRYDKFVYDNIGLKEIQYCNCDNDNLYGKVVHFCDKDGNLLKSETYNSTGVRVSESEISRDNLGRILIATYKNRAGVITSKVEYRYGPSWEPIAQDTKISNGKEVDIKGLREPVYDDKGNLIKMIRYRNDEPLNITERTYKFYDN
jgi:hypothetical protein